MARRDRTVLQYRSPRNSGADLRRRWTRAGDYGARPWWRQVTPVMVALPLAAFTAVLLWPASGVPEAAAVDMRTDTFAARFTLCGSGARVNCVVDGDTFWFHGEKIRVTDINTPETSEPQCAAEAALGRQATTRMLALLNAGPFTLGANPDGRDRDRYDRLLRTVSRNGESLGAVLVREGLAEEWRGYRGSWC